MGLRTAADPSGERSRCKRVIGQKREHDRLLAAALEAGTVHSGEEDEVTFKPRQIAEYT